MFHLIIGLVVVGVLFVVAAVVRAVWISEGENYQRQQRFFKEQEKWQKNQVKAP